MVAAIDSVSPGGRGASEAAGRFGRLSPIAARASLAILALAILIGIPLARMAGGPSAVSAHASHGAKTPVTSDAEFYRAVVRRMQRGEPYEQAAVSEQRAEGYAVKPFLAVRPPALATALSWAPSPILGLIAQALLAIVVIAAWTFRLRAINPGRAVWTAFLIFTGVGAAMSGESASLFHELWAGLLIALSLAVRTDKRFLAAVALGCLAGLIRELAMPYLLVMALFALIEQRRGEAAAFALALAVDGAALALHAHAAMALETARDLVSPSWLALGGWPFALRTAQWNAMVPVLGAWVTAVLVPLALLGAASWKTREGLRLTVVLAGCFGGFMIVGRPDNFYWGLMTAPMIGVGLALAPSALIGLWRRAATRT